MLEWINVVCWPGHQPISLLEVCLTLEFAARGNRGDQGQASAVV